MLLESNWLVGRKASYRLPCNCTGGSVVKNPPSNAGDTGLIPGLGRCPGEGMATYSSILAWEIPRAEEPGGLPSMGLQRVRHGWVINTHLSNQTPPSFKAQLRPHLLCRSEEHTSEL